MTPHISRLISFSPAAHHPWSMVSYLFQWLLDLQKTPKKEQLHIHQRQFQNYLYSSMISSRYSPVEAIKWRLRRVRKMTFLGHEKNRCLLDPRSRSLETLSLWKLSPLSIKWESGSDRRFFSGTCAIASEGQPLFFSPGRKYRDCLCCSEAGFSN